MRIFWDSVLDFGAICGLVSLLYLFVHNLRRRPSFKFDFSGQSGTPDEQDGFYTMRFAGLLKNRSLDPNTITKIYLVVWATARRNSTLRFGHQPRSVTNQPAGDTISLPIAFAPREAKQLEIVFRFKIEGTADEKILSQHISVGPNSQFRMHKHHYELCFEDTNETLFDQQGTPRNRTEMDLRWTLANTTEDLQQGKFSKFLRHYARILRSRAYFHIKLLFQAIGLWR